VAPEVYIGGSHLIFFGLKTPCKIAEHYDNTFWEKSNPAERKRSIKATLLIN
jgi:hypothetical protein